ncbi:cellulose synthase interactive 1-like protein [Tanacetum coccineum]
MQAFYSASFGKRLCSEVPIEVLVRLLRSRSEATLIVALNALLVQESYDSSCALAMDESGVVKALLELVRGHQCEETAARLLEVLMHTCYALVNLLEDQPSDSMKVVVVCAL